MSTARSNGTTVVLPAAAPNAATIRKPTWRIALDHKFSEDILGYVSYNRGIKSGGFNIATPQTAPYLPETLDAYEAGLKTQFLDRRLTVNLAGFYYKYQNLQVQSFQNGTTPVLTNGALSRIYGLDVDFRAKASDCLSLSGGFELLHATFSDCRNAPILKARPTGGSLSINGDATGRRIPLAQNFVGTIAADYTRKSAR